MYCILILPCSPLAPSPHHLLLFLLLCPPPCLLHVQLILKYHIVLLSFFFFFFLSYFCVCGVVHRILYSVCLDGWMEGCMYVCVCVCARAWSSVPASVLLKSKGPCHDLVPGYWWTVCVFISGFSSWLSSVCAASGRLTRWQTGWVGG